MQRPLSVGPMMSTMPMLMTQSALVRHVAGDKDTCVILSRPCSTIASTQGFCGNGKVYDSSKADADCAAAACSKTLLVM